MLQDALVFFVICDALGRSCCSLAWTVTTTNLCQQLGNKPSFTTFLNLLPISFICQYLTMALASNKRALDTAIMPECSNKRQRRLTGWINEQFISSRGNEYFCEIDEEYLTDRFNLTGLNTEVQYYQYALDLITDVFDVDCDDEMREAIEKSARHLYGLVHARYIVTTRGLGKMVCPDIRIDATGILIEGQGRDRLTQ